MGKAEDEQDREWKDSKRDAETIKNAMSSGLRHLRSNENKISYGYQTPSLVWNEDNLVMTKHKRGTGSR